MGKYNWWQPNHQPDGVVFDYTEGFFNILLYPLVTFSSWRMNLHDIPMISPTCCMLIWHFHYINIFSSHGQSLAVRNKSIFCCLAGLFSIAKKSSLAMPRPSLPSFGVMVYSTGVPHLTGTQGTVTFAQFWVRSAALPMITDKVYVLLRKINRVCWRASKLRGSTVPRSFMLEISREGQLYSSIQCPCKPENHRLHPWELA